MMDETGTLSWFVKKYPGRLQAKPSENPDQDRRLGEADGVRNLPPAPVTGVVAGYPPGKNPSDVKVENTHLWILDNSGMPFILEMVPMSDKKVKHTNLTGGAPASCGGEIWFRDADTKNIWISGGSGRYPAKSCNQLDDVVSVFTNFGYESISLGWDEEINKPSRVYRDEF